LGADARVAYAGGKWVFNDKAFSNADGSALKDKEMTTCDMCKLSPLAICKQGGDKDFCKVAGVTGCCPLKKTKDVCKASGTPRKYMPQVMEPTAEHYPKFVDWAKLPTGGAWADFALTDGEVPVGDLLPSQDEIFWGKSIGKVCSNPAAPSGVPRDPPFVCSDNYICDGHHRWSQAKACEFTTGCAAPAKIKVKKANKTCKDILNKVMDWSIKEWGKAENSAKPKISWAEAHLDFAAFTEIDVRFGRTAHETVEQAALAFVNAARDRMASIGLEMKGGDEALFDLFHIHHVPRLWN